MTARSSPPSPFLRETVVVDPRGRSWLVATSDKLFGLAPNDPAFVEDTAILAGHFETQVFDAAEGGARGTPTGHGARYRTRAAALAGHEAWCKRVRTGDVDVHRAPRHPL